jgi:peptide/nickel transport system substrate-binding protein
LDAAGKTLSIGLVEEPETLNPYITQLFTSYKVLWGVMDTLLRFDKEFKLGPGLAESYAISDDGLTYTFNLRKGVTWHDGQPFTAADVVATWKIITDPDFGAFNPLGWDKIESIQTPDEHTAVVKIKEKYAPFLAWVAGATLISPKHLIDKGIDSFKQEFGRKPIGTGPFKLIAWEGGQHIELEKNGEYWGGAPRLDAITVKFVPNTNTLITQLKTGEVQLTDGLGALEYDAVKDLPEHKVLALTGNNWQHIDLKNISHLMDKRVRQALDYATPRQQIVDQLLKGLAEVASGDQGPTTFYFNPNVTPRPFDLEKAAALLTEAGFSKNANGIWEKGDAPLKIEYWIPSGDQTAKLVQQAVAARWRELGVDVEEREEAMNTIWGPNGFQFTQAMTAGQYDWFSPPDPDNMFFWHSSFIPSTPTGAGGNIIAYFNKLGAQDKFDALTAAGAAEADPEKRREIYWQVQELLHEEMPVIFLYWGKRIFVAPKALQGFDPIAALPLLYGAEAWDLAQ